MSNYKKIIGGMLITTFLLAGYITPTVKTHFVIEKDVVSSLDYYLASPPAYTTLTIEFVDTMPNQYSTLYTAEKPINTSPDQSCVFFTYRRLSDNPNYPGSGRLALTFTKDGGMTWSRVWPYNDDGGGRYPQVGPWMGNSDTFICSYANVTPGYGASIATVPSDGDLSQGNIIKYYYATTPFVGFQSFATGSNDLANYVNWMIGADNNYFTHWWWRLGFIDPDPPATVFPNHPGEAWNTDYLGGTLAALVSPDTVKVSYDDGATWSSIVLNAQIPVDTFTFSYDNSQHIVNAFWWTNYWDFALLDASTPVALFSTTCLFTNPIIFGTADTFVAGNGLYLVTPTATYTVIDPDENIPFVNCELTIDHVNNVYYVTYVGYHTIDYVDGSRYGWTDIYVKYSTDGGVTWSAPINITRDEAGQPTDDKIEHQVHTVKHVFGGDKVWLLFNVVKGWDGAMAGYDIHYGVYRLGAVDQTYILTGYYPLMSVGEGSRSFVKSSGLKFSGNVYRNGTVRFISPYDGKMVFELYDLNGRKVETRNLFVNSGTNELRFKNLKSGVYLLKYRGSSEGTYKFLVSE
ncbi:MAG: T9SS type A sorting domain-containing protein [candidate division WOR-3 bacterium]